MFCVAATAVAWCVALLDRWLPPGHCKKCGYNLIGNVSGVCPECGTAMDRLDDNRNGG